MDLLVDSRGNDRVIWHGGFEFLGAPIGSHAFSEKHAADRVQQAKALLSAISDLPDPQVGLRLIRVCAGSCKLVWEISQRYVLCMYESRPHGGANSGRSHAEHGQEDGLPALSRAFLHGTQKRLPFTGR